MDNIKFAAFEQIQSIEPKTLPRRKRSMTTINLQWHGERSRRARDIKQLIDEGKYNISSLEVAKAMLR